MVKVRFAPQTLPNSTSSVPPFISAIVSQRSVPSLPASYRYAISADTKTVPVLTVEIERVAVPQRFAPSRLMKARLPLSVA
ncbi:MAG: hypothetical protein BWY91_01485 [bacterium ADurb.BinA028]|nr:MAG: hypothetical protein BWY91_01485 [bacterium ADurb.BinA028]